MAVHRTSDSMSRCDPSLYSNIYDVRKRPDIKHEPIFATQPTHKDTIEISKDKLKEEALNRLRHTSKYVIVQNSFMRIGKYLFLAVAFPPYLIMYGLPKWILIEGLPAVFSMFVWMWKKVQQKAKKRLDAGVRKATHLVQWLQNIVQVLIQPVVRIALDIRQRIQRMRESTLQFFKRVGNRTKRVILLPYQKVTERLKFVQKRLSQAREKIARQVQARVTQLQEGVQWIKQSPQSLWNWGNMQFQRLNEQTVSWKGKWNQRFQNSQQLAERATTWVSTQFKHGIEGFKRDFAPFIAFYRQQLLPHWHRLKEVCKGRWKQTRDFFHQRHQKALAFLHNKQEKLKYLSPQHLIEGILAHRWMNKLPSRFQYWLKKWLSHPIAQLICKKMIAIYSFISRSLLRGASQALQALSYGVKIFFKTCEFVRVYARLVTQKVLEGLKVSYQACRTFALYILYYFLLCVMIAAILFIWGVQSLGNLMSALTRRLSSINSSFIATLKSKE